MRKSIYVETFKHRNPIPAACRINNMVMSGVITGRDARTDHLPETLAEQAAALFENVRSIVEAAGGGLDDILKMTVWLKDDRDRTVLNREWEKMFPDPGARPARHVLPHTGSSEALIVADFTAVLSS